MSVPNNDLKAQPGTISIRVDVDRKKQGGRAWDVGNGPPDIALCLESEDDEGAWCFPSGSDRNSTHTPQCRDAYSCTFSDVPVSLKGTTIEVFDVDLSENDLIAEGPVVRGSKKMGAATITIVGDGIDDSKFAADPVAIAALLANPKSVKANRETKIDSVISASLALPFCEHVLLERTSAKGASTFRCEGWKGRLHKLGVGDTELLFDATVTSASGKDEELQFFEIQSGPLKGMFLKGSPTSYEIMTLAWVKARKVPHLNAWLCENRASLGYDRAHCTPSPSGSEANGVAKPSSSL